MGIVEVCGFTQGVREKQMEEEREVGGGEIIFWVGGQKQSVTTLQVEGHRNFWRGK